MQADTVFYIILAIIIIDFGFNLWLKLLNASWFDKALPEVVSEVYDQEAYLKSQAYKKTNFKFGLFQYIVQSVLLIVFLSLGGFAWLNDWVYQFTESPLIAALLFFGVLYAAQLVLGVPFGYYQNFFIEERFGFNKSSIKLWLGDLIKSLVLSTIVGGGLLAMLFVIYEELQDDFWWVAWLAFIGFSLFMNLFYSKLIVPIFNKQSPLESGKLREQINAYAEQVGFKLKNIFVIDGSKRSTKANAYFSGFGSQKRITLYDTLIEKLEEEEIVSVLAHEVGHYKKKHIIYNLLISVITTGFTLYIFGLLVDNPLLSMALGVEQPSFHIGLTAFAILFSPISELVGFFSGYLSRKFEFQADQYAAKTYKADKLIAALKKLSKDSLSNLTPHPFYVFVNYSHPTLAHRIKALQTQ